MLLCKVYLNQQANAKKSAGEKAMSRICIPDYEYKERIQKAARLIRERGLDVMVVSSTESDYAGFCAWLPDGCHRTPAG